MTEIIDIASPGANAGALASAIGDLMMYKHILSGEITAPVTHIDIALPSTYRLFKLVLIGVTITSEGLKQLGGALSADGGATWKDTTGYDNVLHFVARSGVGPDVTVGGTSEDAGLLVIDDEGAGMPFSGELTILPGQVDTLKPVVKVDAYNYSRRLGWVQNRLLEEVRVNALRILDIGQYSYSATPDGGNLTAGTYHLYGIPALGE